MPTCTCPPNCTELARIVAASAVAIVQRARMLRSSCFTAQRRLTAILHGARVQRDKFCAQARSPIVKRVFRPHTVLRHAADRGSDKAVVAPMVVTPSISAVRTISLVPALMVTFVSHGELPSRRLGRFFSPVNDCGRKWMFPAIYSSRLRIAHISLADATSINCRTRSADAAAQAFGFDFNAQLIARHHGGAARAIDADQVGLGAIALEPAVFVGNDNSAEAWAMASTMSTPGI